mmetsp:Transcript_98035/g.282781  ORF Transcript_98035/g.282781 Transcript_98035/m.282781 type:complete len:217 (+) Transcript_98035:129-779(+)
MVSLGVATANFGKPFHERIDGMGRIIPGPPEPYFPGVSSVKFAPDSALKVFRESIAKEADIRSFQRIVQEQPGRVGVDGDERRFRDLLPGYNSLRGTVRSLGFNHNDNGQCVPPAMREPVSCVGGGSNATSSCASRQHAVGSGRAGAAGGRPDVFAGGLATVAALGQSRSCANLRSSSEAATASEFHLPSCHSTYNSGLDQTLIRRRMQNQVFTFM